MERSHIVLFADDMALDTENLEECNKRKKPVLVYIQ